MLGVVLVYFNEIFGIPISVLKLLAFIPLFFAVFDAICLGFSKTNLHPYLKVIAGFNITYCFLSIGLALFHVVTITWLGWSYLIVEVILVLCLAYFEWNWKTIL